MRTHLILSLVSLLIGASLVLWLRPPKEVIKTETKIVEVETTNKKTVIKENKDGSKVTEIVEVVKVEKDTKVNEVKTINTKPEWIVGLSLSEDKQAISVEKNIISNIYGGIYVQKEKQEYNYGVRISITF